MPLVYCDRSIVDYNQPEGIVVSQQPQTVESQVSRQVLGSLRPSAHRERPSRLRTVNGDLTTVLGPVAHGANPRYETAGKPPLSKGSYGTGVEIGAFPVLPTPPSTASDDFRHTLELEGLPRLTARRPGQLCTTPRSTVFVGSRSAREVRLRPSKPIDLKKSKSARGSNRAAVHVEEQDGRGQRRIQGARHDASGEDPGADMFVRSEYTGIERNLMEWAVEPQGYSKELQSLQQLQNDFDLDRMRTAELMAHITTRHNSMQESEKMSSADGFWDQRGRWKPTPFIACIRKCAWKDAAQLLKWSTIGAKRRRTFTQSDEYTARGASAQQTQEKQSYERPDYSVDTDRNANTALHHCLAPYQADVSPPRGSKKEKVWHPKGSKGAVSTRHRPPPEFLTALITANPAAIGTRNRNGLTPLHFALGCTTTEINASVDTIIEMCEACPTAVRVKTNTAELPLHLAAAKSAPESVLRKLIQLYPDACIEANCWGSLPIHVGLVNGMPEAQIRVLIKANPSTIGEVDEDGKTPCAIALTIGAPMSTVMFLVNEYADCLSVRDAHGLSPLALALINQAPEATILKLLEFYPKAILMETNHLLELPLHAAIRHAQRHSSKLKRASSSRSGSRGSQRRHDEGHVPAGMRRTGQCWPIKDSRNGDGFHVPPSRGGLPPAQQGHGGQDSRGGLLTPSMKFTPQASDTEAGLLGTRVGASAKAGSSAVARTEAVGITVSAGTGFAPGSLELPAVSSSSSGQPLAQTNSYSRPRAVYQKEVVAQTHVASGSTNVGVTSGSTNVGGTTPVRPFSAGATGYLEHIVRALLAADEEIQKNRSPESRKEPGVTKGRTIEAVDLHGRTPLHIACIRQVPTSVIEPLVDANPAAVEAKDQDGWVPLHRYVNGPAFAAASDSLCSVLTLLEVCPALAAQRHAPLSVEQVKKQQVELAKRNRTLVREEMMADTGAQGSLRPKPPQRKPKGALPHLTQGRREAIEESARKRRPKAYLRPRKPLDDADNLAADPRKSRKEEEARLGRKLTQAEGIARLEHMRNEQEEERAIHIAKIANIKSNRRNGVETELFPYELADKHRLQCVGSIGQEAARMAKHVRSRTTPQ